jgi:FRG domain
METKHLETWQAFDEALCELRAKEEAPAERGGLVLRSKFLFRGQSDERWDLTTTLERRFPRECKWSEYLHLIRSAAPEVETITGRLWQIPARAETRTWGGDYDDEMRQLPAYDYWVYLRHHGFPSPLLDWTRSPYVAAFFAFRQTTAERVAIYCYQEASDGAKFGSSDRPHIHVHGPYVRSHPRHVLQQCTYTTCNLFKDKAWSYSRHSSVFSFDEKRQDRLWKFTIPASERMAVLRNLDEYNLNAYSLFSTEDALLETVALRELEFRILKPLA